MRSHSPAQTANDRFKRGFGSWFWLGLLAATLAHAALFILFPSIGLDPLAEADADMAVLAIPDRIELPPPPERVATPAAPAVGDVELDDDLTIPKNRIEDVPIDVLPPPPGSSDDLSEAPVFTPSTTAPRLENAAEVRRLLERFYPPLLRDAGIGGTVSVWFFIDADGRVVRTLVNESSGYATLDQAALEVADRMRFGPAWNKDKRVPVWVSISIVFEVGG